MSCGAVRTYLQVEINAFIHSGHSALPPMHLNHSQNRAAVGKQKTCASKIGARGHAMRASDDEWR